MTADQIRDAAGTLREIDPEISPDLANKIAQFAMRDEKNDQPVLIPAPPDGTVTLPGGLRTRNGEMLRDAVVRELSGADEEELSKPMYRRDYFKMVDELLQRCVVSVGGREAGRELLDALLIGDRDMLMQAIRVATFGDTMKLPLVCPMATCEHEFKVKYSFSKDVKIRQMDGHVVELPDESKIVLEQGRTVYEVPLRRGRSASVSLLDGGMQRTVYTSENAKLSTAERNTMVLQQCVQAIDGEPPFPHDIRELGAGDRLTLIQFIGEAQPGPLWSEVKATCPSCEGEFPLVIDVPTMFRGF